MTGNVYKHFVLLGALSYWPAAIFMARKWWSGRQATFSAHAASNKSAYRIFGVAVTLETTFYLVFAFKWFIPNFGMPFIFGLLVSLIAAGHFIAGIIPETKGLSKWIHRKLSYVSVILFLPVFLIIVITYTIPLFARVLAAVYIIVELVLWYVYLNQPIRHKEDIVGQAIFISSLPIVLIAATYLR